MPNTYPNIQPGNFLKRMFSSFVYDPSAGLYTGRTIVTSNEKYNTFMLKDGKPVVSTIGNPKFQDVEADFVAGLPENIIAFNYRWIKSGKTEWDRLIGIYGSEPRIGLNAVVSFSKAEAEKRQAAGAVLGRIERILKGDY